MNGTLGVLLAGGRGSRFGGAKALARFRGVPLVEKARAELGAVCDAVVVVAPGAMILPVPAAERVADAAEGEGPLSALVAGLESRPASRALALAVDLPLLDAGLLARLLGAAGGALALVPAPGGRLQPLAAVYDAAAAPRLRASLDRGERAVVRAVEALPPRRLDDAALAELGIPARCFVDADTPGDLARLEALAS